MAGGILNTAAQRIKASTAGHTYVVGSEPSPGAPAAATVTETVRRLVPTASGALDSIFRMEPVPAPVSSPALKQPTTATRGPHGGLVPSGLSHLFGGNPAPSPSPGPYLAPEPIALPSEPQLVVPKLGGVQLSPMALRDDTTEALKDVAQRGASLMSTIRRRLGL